ncbi:MAG: hypothetical protein ACR2PX_12010 [Endozoicomonas sp.]|uniref:hypothetical protein n=1 Tax=Endozoicomonas sp. TaxID=1892382 RepID=UPI003D9B32F6
MSTSLIVLVGYIGWIITLLISLEVFRTVLVVQKGRTVDSFSHEGNDTTPFDHRLARAYANM